jgi:lysophospholipid hydrolase
MVLATCAKLNGAAASSLMTPTSLAATEFLQGCDLKTLEEMMAGFTPVHLPDGVALFRQGDSATAMYLIINGRLRMETTLEQGGEAPADEIGPGDMVGEIPLLVGGAHSSTMTAIGDSTLVEISKDVFDRLVARHPQMLLRARELARQRLRRDKLASVLHNLFGQLDQAARRRIEAEVEWVVVPCGAALYRRGEASESLYFLVCGRMLAVVDDEQGKERMGAEITPGKSVGETGFLADRPHTKSIYAIRDSTLAKFSRESFNRLLEQYPQALRQISRLAIRSLEPTLPAAPSEAETIHVAVIPLGPEVPVAEFSRRLVNALAAHGATLRVEREMISQRVGARSVTTTSLDSPALIRLEEWLDAQETTHRFIVYEADSISSPWTERCLRQADRILLVAQANTDLPPGLDETRFLPPGPGPQTPRQTLVLLHSDGNRMPLNTGRWLATLPVENHHHLRMNTETDFARLARFVADRAIGLVLGGGGARGWAHLGVISALEEAGIPIDVVGGTSMGAVIAAQCALGWDIETLLEKNRIFARANIYDLTVPLLSLLSGRRKAELIERFLGQTEIEDLWLPFFCVSSNLTRADEMVHRRGSLRRAVIASTSLPGIMPPVVEQGDLLVDGSVLNNLPMDVMRGVCGRGTVIAVDVSAQGDFANYQPFGEHLSGWRALRSRLNPWGARFNLPSIAGILGRAQDLASAHRRADQLRQGLADFYLRPPVDQFGLLDFKEIDRIVDVGHRFARERIASWSARPWSVGEELLAGGEGR